MYKICYKYNTGSRNIDVCDHLNKFLEFIIQDQHKSTTHASQHIGPGTFEESFTTLIFKDLLPAVDCSCVHDVSSFPPRLHHHTTSHCVEWVGSHTSHSCDSLSYHPTDHNMGVVGIWEHSFGSVVDSKVSSPVNDDALYGHVEALVQALQTIRPEDLGEAIS